jgi:hypothetical protein
VRNEKKFQRQGKHNKKKHEHGKKKKKLNKGKKDESFKSISSLDFEYVIWFYNEIFRRMILFLKGNRFLVGGRSNRRRERKRKQRGKC